MLTIPAVAYSNEVLRYSGNIGIHISPLKLQKLVYLSYAMRLKNQKEQIDQLRFEAWQYGPVISAIYYAYQHYGSEIVRSYLRSYEDNAMYFLRDDKKPDVVEAVTRYGHMHGYELIDIVHKPEGAWWKAYSQGMNTIIEHTEIAKEFSVV